MRERGRVVTDSEGEDHVYANAAQHEWHDAPDRLIIKRRKDDKPGLSYEWLATFPASSVDKIEPLPKTATE